MALKAKMQGRAAVTRNLNAFVPNALKYAAEANLKVVQEVAEKISAVAPTGATLEYMEGFSGDFLKNHPDATNFSKNPTKDKDATGLFAPWTWRFLEYGTAPHSTAPGGGTVAGRAAAASNPAGMHPGTTAQPHIWPTWNAFRATAIKIKKAAISKAFREFNRK